MWIGGYLVTSLSVFPSGRTLQGEPLSFEGGRIVEDAY
jgi:hypothetical protein